MNQISSRVKWLVASETSNTSTTFCRNLSTTTPVVVTIFHLPPFHGGKNSLQKFIDLDPDDFKNFSSDFLVQ